MIVKKAQSHYKTQSMTVVGEDGTVVRIPKEKLRDWQKTNGIPHDTTLDQYLGREVTPP